ncbi:FapA family protein [Ruminococcaceae bacterium OttesenSCG-928-O06]|nr:FapA family protein [Ruminococcaceae bacterium OttesenSCG-928-O06]
MPQEEGSTMQTQAAFADAAPATEETPAPDAAPQVESRDAVVQVTCDTGYMHCQVLVEAPQGEGRGIQEEDIRAALQKKGVVHGIDDNAIRELTTPLYGQAVQVATGTPAQDGVDGTVTELFPREVSASYTERDDGTVDYKELGLVRDVREGTLICEGTLPTEGVDGANVLGKPIKAHQGVKALPPVGENIRVSEDGLRAEAAVAGNLVFRDGRFVIDTVYRVQNVDYDTGNITFSGDVQVNGDMLDGFEIHAGGTVTLRGQAGAVVVKAGGDIIIEKGINGTGRALLETEHTLKAGFIENCNIRAAEKIIANSIINCQVECEGDVEVEGGKGIICGGRVTAFGSVRAKEIGNDFNTLTVIVLGVTPRLLKERKRIVDQLEDVTRHIEELVKNVNYIERLVADGRPVPPERVQMLKRAQIQLPMTEKKKEQLESGLLELETKMAEVNTSTLTARVIHPPTKISIGALSTNVIETRQNSRVYKSSEGELVFGSS